jgi:hypothetical protein
MDEPQLIHIYDEVLQADLPSLRAIFLPNCTKA